jgi:hypothetical protein
VLGGRWFVDQDAEPEREDRRELAPLPESGIVGELAAVGGTDAAALEPACEPLPHNRDQASSL